MAADLFQRAGGYRLRFQIAGAIACALLPYIVRYYLSSPEPPVILLASVSGSLAASLTGMFFVRNINVYPGVEGSAYIVPSFFISFALVLSIFFFGRFTYSRSLFMASFLLDCIFFYGIYFVVQRGVRITVGVVPGGDVTRLVRIDRIQWVRLHSPQSDFGKLAAVAVDLRADLSDEWERRLADFALAGLPVYHSKHLHESLTGRVELERLSENNFGTLSPVSAYMTLKHCADWLAAFAAIILLLPLFLLLSLLIMIDSPGSPIFWQRRIGYRGQPFVVWKFRTMRSPGRIENALTAAMTATGDARVTRIGRFLRKSRLDELPQLVNVLKGEMSWIGPRPEAEILSQWYESEIPFYRYRHIVRPGITGWAQITQGHVAEVNDVRTKLHYDFYYIKNFSPWIDFLIVARTIKTMLTGFGAR